MTGSKKLSGKRMQVLTVRSFPMCTKEVREGGYGQASLGSAAPPLLYPQFMSMEPLLKLFQWQGAHYLIW